MPHFRTGIVVLFCVTALSCRNSRNGILHHGTAKVSNLTPTQGSVVVQTPSMLPQGMVRSDSITPNNLAYANNAVPVRYDGSTQAVAALPAVASAPIRAISQPVVSSQPAAQPFVPASNASATAPSEFTRAPAGADPFLAGKPAAVPGSTTAESYRPAYRSEVQPLTPPMSTSTGSAKAANVEELSPPVQAPARNNVIATSGRNDAVEPLTPPPASNSVAPASSAKPSGTKLFDELLPPR